MGFVHRGEPVGWVMDRSKIAWFLIALGCLILFYFWRLPNLGLEASRLLGLTLCVLILWMSDALPVTATSFILLFAMPFLGIRPLNTVLADFGTSPALWVMCLLVVAMGMSYTQLARRLAYWYILKLGTNASRLLLAMVATTSTLSIFVADTPTIAMIYPIAMEILERLGIRSDSADGSRNLGKAMMIGIPIGSVIGGCGLISGSGINIMGITVLEKFTGMKIGYLEWACFGLPFVVLATVPAWWILNKWFKVDKVKVSVNREDIRRRLQDLGPFSVDEKRVLAIIGLMLVLFVTSDFTRLPLTLACFLAFVLTISPGIGVVDWRRAQSVIAWDAVLIIGATTGFAYAIKDTGLGPYVVKAALGGWISDVHPWLVILVASLIGVFSHVLIIGNNAAAVAVCLGCMSALIGTTGLNPALILLPVVFTGAAGVIIPIQVEFFITKPSGFWEFKDVPLPGALVGLMWAIVTSVVFIAVGSARGYL